MLLSVPASEYDLLHLHGRALPAPPPWLLTRTAWPYLLILLNHPALSQNLIRRQLLNPALLYDLFLYYAALGILYDPPLLNDLLRNDPPTLLD